MEKLPHTKSLLSQFTQLFDSNADVSDGLSHQPKPSTVYREAFMWHPPCKSQLCLLINNTLLKRRETGCHKTELQKFSLNSGSVVLYIIPEFELHVYLLSLKNSNTNNALKFGGMKKYRIEVNARKTLTAKEWLFSGYKYFYV